MSAFQYRDQKSYVRAYIARLPRKGRGEISRIAAHLRVSTTLVNQVLVRDKSFTPEQAQSLIGFLGLTGLEADYFTFLVQRDRAGTTELRKFWESKLAELREQSLKLANRVSTDRQLSETERAVFYSSPLYSAIRLFTSVGNQGQTLEDVSQRFELSRTKAGEMLQFLVQTGLCSEKNGRFAMGFQKTHLEEGSPHLLRHHGNWRIRAIRQSEDLRADELMYTAPVSLSKKDFDSLREEMVSFIKRFLDQVHASPAEEVACFNLDFFWVRK